MREFWVSCGHHLTRRTESGGLAVTDELLLAYLARPELVPPQDACPAEHALHAALAAAPRRPVAPAEVAAIADADARENWRFMLAFRDRLVGARSIEALYLDLARNGAGGVPPLFMNQITHLILRNALEGCGDPYVLRAAELFFRPQRASVHDGALMLADAEIVERHQAEERVSPLLAMFGGGLGLELDVMDDANAWSYWSRSDAFTMVLNFGANPRSRDGLARAIETWLRHLLGVATRVEPATLIEDVDWRWFVGLDAQATRIGNALWRHEDPGEDTLSRIVGLFRLTFVEEALVEARARGHPVYLILAMDQANIVRMKPHNLVTGLPLTSALART